MAAKVEVSEATTFISSAAQKPSPTTPVHGWYTVPEEAIAEALRAKASAEYVPKDANFTVAGNNTVPEYIGVNWGGVVENALQPFAEANREKKAAAAESDAAAARTAALSQLGVDMPADQLLALGSELEMPELQKAAIAKMLPEKEKMANFLQAIPNLTPDGAAMLAPQYGLDPEQARKMVVDYQSNSRDELAFKTDEEIRKTNATRTPVAGQKLSAEEAKYNLWSQANPGKNYNDYLAAVGGGKQTKAEAGKAAETAEIGGNLAQSAADLRALIESDVDGELFGWLQGASTASSNIGEKNAGTFGGELASWLGGKAENSMTTELRALNLDAVLEQARKLAPVTDTDFSKLMLSKPNAFKTKESALAFVDHLERVAKRYGIPMGGAGAATGLPWSPDLGMTEAQWNKQTPEWQKRFMEAK